MSLNIKTNKIGIVAKSGWGEKPEYQYELLENYKVDKIILINGSRYIDNKDINKLILNSKNTLFIFTDISRLTRQGHRHAKELIEIILKNNGSIIFILGENFQNLEITNENINSKLFIEEANNAIKQNYLRKIQTTKGIEIMSKLHEQNNTKPNTGLPLKQDIVKKIEQKHLEGLSIRKIANELDINRNTVDKYIKKYKEDQQ
jgi:DNA invertase Pin-like site-specific DNA recombinase